MAGNIGIGGVNKSLSGGIATIGGVNRTLKSGAAGIDGVNKATFTSDLIIEDAFDAAALDSSKWIFEHEGPYYGYSISSGNLILGYGAIYDAGSDSYITTVMNVSGFTQYTKLQAEIDIRNITDGSYREMQFCLPANSTKYEASPGVLISNYSNEGIRLTLPKSDETSYTSKAVYSGYPAFPFLLKITYDASTHYLEAFKDGVSLGGATVENYSVIGSTDPVFVMRAVSRSKGTIGSVKLTLSK